MAHNKSAVKRIRQSEVRKTRNRVVRKRLATLIKSVRNAQNKAEGEKVGHSYLFDNNLTIEYPLIHTISLLVIDNLGAISGINHQIMLYPSKYILYFKNKELVTLKPSSSQEKIKASLGLININPSKELTYKLKKLINLSSCSWNCTVYLKKPWLTRLTKIKLELYDSDNKKISNTEKKLFSFI